MDRHKAKAVLLVGSSRQVLARLRETWDEVFGSLTPAERREAAEWGEVAYVDLATGRIVPGSFQYATNPYVDIPMPARKRDINLSLAEYVLELVADCLAHE